MKRRLLFFVLSALFVGKSYATIVVEKVWENTTDAPSNAKVCCGWDGVLYAKNYSGGVIYAYSANGRTTFASEGNSPWGVAMDEAGNMVSRTEASYYTASPGKMNIYVKGSTTAIPITFSGISGRVDFITADGDFTSSTGGKVYFFPKNGTEIKYVLIKDANVSSKTATVSVGTLATGISASDVEGYVQSGSSLGMIAHQRGGNRFVVGGGTMPSLPNISKTANGLAIMTIKNSAGTPQEIWTYPTSNAKATFNVRNITTSANVAAAAGTGFYIGSSSQATGSNTLWMSVQKISDYCYYLYVLAAGNAAACFRIYENAPANLAQAVAGKTIRRSILHDGSLFVLAIDDAKEPYLYKVNPETQEIEAVIPTTGLGTVTNTSSTSGIVTMPLADIAFTDDNVLIGCQAEHTKASADAGTFRVYKWNSLSTAPSLWLSSKVSATAGNFSNAITGFAMTYIGSSTAGQVIALSNSEASNEYRFVMVNVSSGAYSSTGYNRSVTKNTGTSTILSTTIGLAPQLIPSPFESDFILMGSVTPPIAVTKVATGSDTQATYGRTNAIPAPSVGSSILTVDDTKYMIVPSADGVKVYDITSGLASATLEHTFTQANTATFRYAAAKKEVANLVVYFQTDGTITKLTANGFLAKPAESVSLSPTSIVIPVQGTATLAAPTIQPAEAEGNTITWSTGNSAIATVTNGVVTGVSAGTTTIKATVDGVYGECTVEVCNPVAHILPYDLRRTLNNDGQGYTFTFKSNIAATSGKIIFYQGGVKKGEVPIASSITSGTNEVVVAKSDMPQIEGVMTWAIELTGADSKVIGEITNPSRDLYNFYMTQGVAVDNSTESNYFGNIYVTAPANGASDGLTARSKNQKAGLFVYDPLLNELNEVSNQGYKMGLELPNGSTGDEKRYNFKRVNVDAEGNVYVNSKTAIYKASPADLTTSTTIGEGLFTTINSFCIDDDILYVMDNASSLKKLQSGTVTPIVSSDKLINAYNSVIQDGHGGWWICQNRSTLDTYNALCHVNSNNTIDFSINQSSNSSLLAGNVNVSFRGAVALNPEKDILVMSSNNSVVFFDVEYNGSGTPTLTKKNWTLPSLGSQENINIDGIAFDYAGNLFIVSSTTERLFMFALPTEENKTLVPAKSTLTVDAQEHIAVTSISLSQTSASLEIGETLDLTANCLPSNATDNTVEWHSDNSSVATVNVSTGRVTALAVGTAHITAVSSSDEIESDVCTVEVYTLDFNVSWQTNGASSTTIAPSANSDLWLLFENDYNEYYNVNRATRVMTQVEIFASVGVIDILTDNTSHWKWLGNHIQNTATDQSIVLSTESQWTAALQDFFTCTAVNVDFTTAGQFETWLPLWKEANNYLPRTMREGDEMPVITKGNDLLVGWYDNESFEGTPITSVTHDITLYAKWIESLTLNEEGNNSTAIDDHDGETLNVILQRSFLAENGWYTLVLPFDVDAEQMEAIFGNGYRVAVLEDAYMKSANALLLRFADRDYIEAGMPCLFHTGQDVTSDIVFHNVTIDNSEPVHTAGIVSLHGLYDQTTVLANDEGRANYYLGYENYLYPYSSDILTKAFRAYFDLSQISNPSQCSARVIFRDEVFTDDDMIEQQESNGVQKILRNGEILIIRNGNEYTIDGRLHATEVK